jgi:hypothetical protein
MFAVCPCVNAAGFTIDIHSGSYHFINNQDFNGFNPGLGISTERGQTGFQLGTLRNSTARLSVYASVSRRLLDFNYVSFDLGAGIITGYDNKYSRAMAGISPLGYVTAAFNLPGRFQPVLTLMPGGASPALLLSTRIRF